MTPTVDYAGLTDQDLIDLLFSEEDRLPRAAVDEILRRGAPMAERLFRILDADESWDADLPRWWAVVHAVFLVAALKPPGALEVLLRAVEKADGLDVDWIADDARFLLGSFGPPAIPVLKPLAEEESGDPWFRILINEAMGWIAQQHPEVRDEVLPVLRGIASDPSAEANLRAFAGAQLLDFLLPEDRELILSVADEEIFARQDVEEEYSGKIPVRPRQAHDWMEFYDPARIAERQARWKQEDRRHEEKDDRPLLLSNKGARPEELPELGPYIPELPGPSPDEDIAPLPLRAEAKVGRNDACPCASGKKYKKCCGR